MRKNIVVLGGDGIGPEVTAEAVKVLHAVADKYHYELNCRHELIGHAAIEATGQPLPQTTIDACLDADAVLLGAIGHPKYDADPGAPVRPEAGLLQLRKTLQLYANIRPVQIYPSLMHLSPVKNERLKKTDMLIVRELTGGIYFGKKSISDTSAVDECTYTDREIERVARLAFSYALNRRQKLTLVDKANVLATSRLWRKIVQEIAEEFPEVSVDYMYVDNAAMQLIMNPSQFDVILTENMFGDILSDEASVLSGSLGLLPSASTGNTTPLFEPIHGSYPQAAGKNIANPIGAILSVAMLFDYLELNQASLLIRQAVQEAIRRGITTTDINPGIGYSTSSVGDFICDYIHVYDTMEINYNNIELGQSTII